MNKQFVFLNFHTEYSSSGTLDKEMRREYCFGDVFYAESHQENEYNIIIYRNLSAINDGKKNNACFLDKDALLDYVNIAQRIHKFDVSIENETDDKFELYVYLNAPRVIHRYILTWIRYAYEYPFNMYLMDAIALKNIEGFKDDDLFNLFNLVGASNGMHFHGDNIHCIGDVNWPRKFYNPEEQINIVNKANATSEVNPLFPKIRNIKIKTLCEKQENYSNYSKSLEYWNDEKSFATRLQYYYNNKNKILNEAL